MSHKLFKSKKLEIENNEVCSDFYWYFCKKNQSEVRNSHNFKHSIEHSYSKLMAMFTSIINNSHQKSKSAYVEQELYKSCMKLDENIHDDDRNANDTDHVNNILDLFSVQKFFNDMLKKFSERIYENDWKILDGKLASLGFGHTFFDINVINDFSEPKKKVILLEPPSLKKWNAKKFPDLSANMLIQMQTKTFEYCKNVSKVLNEKRKSQTEEKIEILHYHGNMEKFISLCEPFQNVTLPLRSVIKDENLLDMYSLLVKLEIQNFKVTDPEYQDFTIESWINLYNHNVRNDISRLDWLQIFKNTFTPFGITINNNTIITVRNKVYFFKLAKIVLNYFPNESIIRAIQLKFVSDYIRYYDWNWAQSIDFVETSVFCFQETKLYGISNIVLELFQREYMVSNIKRFNTVKINVVNVLACFVETYYATYGVNMGAFLYSLLRENKFKNVMNEQLFHRLGSEWFIPYGTYPPLAINCFIPKNAFKYGHKLAFETITEIFGVQLAYEAMLEDLGNNVTKDFFKAYTQAQCTARKKIMINKVISNFKEIYTTFHCSDTEDERQQCSITPFDV
ncbi:uncharacterized protein LOC106642607 [Copidosoma floridanum]|uniref:uncharacterized protein LOC106642607 n=1 Tax=Copidosoma floridanum TaxID=29053 RepID=UPI000C6FA282|nr:uncharacterized protein LOC106642607 [Copidosoma floridanum]